MVTEPGQPLGLRPSVLFASVERYERNRLDYPRRPECGRDAQRWRRSCLRRRPPGRAGLLPRLAYTGDRVVG